MAPQASHLPRWMRSVLLPGVLIDVREEDHSRRDRVVDVAMYVVASGISAITLADTWTLHRPWVAIANLAIGVVAVAALHWRRTHPAAVGIWTAAASILLIAATGPQLVGTFNAAIRASGRELSYVAGLAVASCFSIPLLYPGSGGWSSVAIGLGCTAIVIGWGLFVRARRELVLSLREQAQRADVETRAAERRRIAREMHDVLGHRLSLLSLHAGALEFHPDASPEVIAEAAGVIRESASAALDELGVVIGVLCEEGGEQLTEPPQPTLADLPALVEESRAAGMRLTALIELGDAAPLAAIGRTAYRIAQEGLTNARKHAPGAAVTLTVQAPGDGLEVEVRSLAPVASAVRSPLRGTGTGLIGLAERVSLANGQLEHGVDPDGAFVLRARLPR